MPPKKTAKPPKLPPEKTAPTMLAIRGLSPADHEALMEAVARRKAAIGAYVSLNATVLGLLRAGLAREKASGVIDTAPAAEGT